MNRYKSSQRWRKQEPGVYSSPCGRFMARREGYSRWTLTAVDAPVRRGPFMALADCQEHVENLQNSLGGLR